MVDCTQLTTINPKCRDPLDNCEDYGQEACVDPYLAWAESNCPYYCGLKTCGDQLLAVESTVPPRDKTDLSGWTILMKGVAGVPNDDLYRLWASSETRNANNSIAMRPTADFLGNYKPALSNFWDTCKFDQGDSLAKADFEWT
nr:hypothetical protein BaRGS_021865 [Batillaria attramentaria]